MNLSPQVGTPLRGVRRTRGDSGCVRGRLGVPSLPLILLLLGALLAPLSAFAQAQSDAPGVRFEQRIGEQLPLDTPFIDSSGTPCRLGDFFHGKPVVLFFGYARCPQLCSIITDGTTRVLRRLVPTAGKDYQIVHISIDPTESPLDSKSAEDLAVRRYGRTGAEEGWHYLTGTKAAIARVTDAAGFHFLYDSRSKLYAHASGFLIATPTGVISRYFLGVDFVGDDVAPALRRAGEGKVGRTVFELILLCCRGGKIGGRYGKIIWDTLGVSVALTVVGLFGGVGWMLFQEHRGRRASLVAGRDDGGFDPGRKPFGRKDAS